MIASAIRSLASGRESRIIAAAFVEKTVQIWDLDSCRQISQFNTVYDFGGEIGRLTISPTGNRCVCAASTGGRKGGVGCYEAATGQVAWHRPELKQTQWVSYSPSGDFVWWMPETGSTRQLNSGNGDPDRLLRDTAQVFEDRYSNALFIVPRNRAKSYLFGESNEHRIRRVGFAVLDVAFAPDCLCVTEATGPTRCFASSDGVELWRYVPPHQAHIMQLQFVEALHAFFGILYRFDVGIRSLIRLDPTCGNCTFVCDLHGSWAFCFCEMLSVLVTSAGSVICIHDGREMGRLDFPQKKYSEPKMA